MLGTDPTNVSYNLYFNGTKLSDSPFISSTNYVHNTSTDGTYTVRAIINGVEQPSSETANVWANQYLDIALQVPAGGTTPDGIGYTYSPNDCSVGDVDGTHLILKTILKVAIQAMYSLIVIDSMVLVFGVSIWAKIFVQGLIIRNL
jgi:hypothetical protein